MNKLRLGFCKNTGSGKGKEISGVLVNQTYSDILSVAKNKLKIKSKNIRLFIAQKVGSIPAGLELNENNIDCLINDIIICVSLGEDFYLAKDKMDEACSITCPFVWKINTSNMNLISEIEIKEENLLQISSQKTKIKYKLFCDLDGVLVDFEKGVFSLTNKHTNQFTKCGDMWKEISKKNNFWTDLEWTQDGKELWDFIQNNNKYLQCEILTGIPEGKMGIDADKQKNIWCKTNLNNNIQVNTCIGKQKHIFSKSKNILIDDRLENKVKWEENGGIFIHHVNSNKTIEELQLLLNFD